VQVPVPNFSKAQVCGIPHLDSHSAFGEGLRFPPHGYPTLLILKSQAPTSTQLVLTQTAYLLTPHRCAPPFVEMGSH
jgi:hypothetical protein